MPLPPVLKATIVLSMVRTSGFGRNRSDAAADLGGVCGERGSNETHRPEPKMAPPRPITPSRCSSCVEEDALYERCGGLSVNSRAPVGLIVRSVQRTTCTVDRAAEIAPPLEP